jgi:hypothetical protein
MPQPVKKGKAVNNMSFRSSRDFPSVRTIEIFGHVIGHVTENFRQRILTIILTIAPCTVLEMLPGDSGHMINHPN